MATDLDIIVQRLNELCGDNLWEVGKMVTKTVQELPQVRGGHSNGKILQGLVAHPDAHFALSFLRECQALYKVYPDITSKQLPQSFYLALATQVHDAEERKAFEKEALSNGWNLTQLKKAIWDRRLARTQAEKSKYGFDLCVTNLWYFNSADPRFGKSHFKGRIAGQIVANALHYYTRPVDYIVDPFAGSGTLGDVIDKLEYFHDRRYKMYDLYPIDERIQQNDVLNGIPERDESVDYVFLDPPYGSIPRGYYSGQDSDLARMNHDEFCIQLKSVIKECHRMLKSGGRVSIILEPYLTLSSFFDFPGRARNEFLQQGFRQIGKVYVANQTMRGGLSTAYMITESKRRNFMISDCRELLTFKK
ncbi:MAG: hypothetical protein ACETVW_00875 [Dehalococcoidia bacterium]